MSKEPILLQVENLHKQYSQPGLDVIGPKILNGLNLVLNAGESMSVTGVSGSGKSTLLNIIAGLDLPTSGCVMFEQMDLFTFSEDELANYRNQEIGLIFQDHHLLPQCTVLENILMPTLVQGNTQSKQVANDYAFNLLGKVGLSERHSYYPSHLSGGERQRVAVVRSLINKPKLILADEPTGALDQKTANGLVDLLCKFSKAEHVSLIMVTHSLELAGKMNRIEVLREGVLKSV